jgi:TRAP-type mannitol/chloroaromatic compound transport system permease small subunit
VFERLPRRHQAALYLLENVLFLLCSHTLVLPVPLRR